MLFPPTLATTDGAHTNRFRVFSSSSLAFPQRFGHGPGAPAGMVVLRATIPRLLNAVVPVGCASGFVPQAGQGREDSGRPLSNGQIAVAADAERQAESHIGVPLSRLGEQHGLALVHIEVGT